MPEYIEREKVLSKAAPVEGCFSDMISAYDVIMLPAADVAPVVHGRWIHEHISEGYAWVMCSECEAVVHKILINKRLNYCPNCGAKMDLGNYEEMQ